MGGGRLQAGSSQQADRDHSEKTAGLHTFPHPPTVLLHRKYKER